jgi:AcrR family transcriptional regulator
MSSQKSIPGIRAPQRRRGHARVASLLDAAASCFVEKGYDAATMTEIAASSGASIGSLYQFFPTKEALALALIDRYADALQEGLQKLVARSVQWDDDELGTQLIRLLVTFRRRHPAFTVLIESTASTSAVVRGIAVRQQLRGRLHELLVQRLPKQASADLYAAAEVILQLMKAAVAVNAEPGLASRKQALDQLQLVMQLYLHSLSRVR